MTSNAPEKGDGQGWFATVKELLVTLVEALAVAFVIHTLLFQPFTIPSSSMLPTLLVGDYLYVSKSAYGYSKYSMWGSPDLFSGRLFAAEPQRGDVVVFKLPSDNKTDYIKRVIGLPGDRIQMQAGRLYINGELVPREALPKERIAGDRGEALTAPAYMETLPGGVRHKIIEVDGDRGPLDDTGVFTVPAGHFFMMGDNRDNSTDSRVPQPRGVGYVPFENLVGRADRVLFSVNATEADPSPPFWRWPFIARWSRILQIAH